jgi:hypothetical protein
MPVIQFSGGWVDVLSSRIFFTLHVTSYVFLVSCSYIFMPGSAIAAEWVFSGGRDTNSLCCASLHADTIQILLLVKKRLHLACAKANTALRH